MGTGLEAKEFFGDARALREELGREGALQFQVRASGLLSASDISNPELARLTGMDMAWFRDNAHVANALMLSGEGDWVDMAKDVGHAFLRILHRNEGLIKASIADPNAPRLPVRVDAETLENDTEPRLQNDSTGYSVWLPGKLMNAGILQPKKDDLAIMDLVVQYLDAHEYWHELEEGQWEEDRQIHASSIGVAVAGLRAVMRAFIVSDYHPSVDPRPVLQKGLTALHGLVRDGETPRSKTYAGRKYDASHLFLAETVRVFRGNMALNDNMVKRVEQKLVRKVGVIRYPGDSYYAPGFTEMLKPGERTSQAEGRLQKRDMLGPDAKRTKTEAQWTLFDPLLSAYWGRRFERTHDSYHRAKQIAYLDRALKHYVLVDKRGPRVPEMFYQETVDSPPVPNDHVPLLWSQGNMLQALRQFEQTT